MIFNNMNWKPAKIFHDLSKPTGAHSRIVSNDRAAKILGFGKNNWISIEGGIKRTIDWYVSTHEQKQVAQKIEILLKDR